MANEKRLIDANALKSDLMKLEASGGHKYYRKGMDDTLHFHMPNIIDDAPTVDAVEVVHGRWEQMGETDYKCSVCGFRFTSCDPISMFKHCRCGAKMDGDGNG